MNKKILNWLWDGAPKEQSFKLQNIDIEEFTKLINTYTTEKNWEEKKVKKIYDSNLYVVGKVFNYVSDMNTGHCKVKITATKDNKDLQIEIYSQTYWGRPKGDPEINTRIISGIENYLRIHNE